MGLKRLNIHKLINSDSHQVIDVKVIISNTHTEICMKICQYHSVCNQESELETPNVPLETFLKARE